jgi:hypothetical protein
MKIGNGKRKVNFFFDFVENLLFPFMVQSLGERETCSEMWFCAIGPQKERISLSRQKAAKIMPK